MTNLYNQNENLSHLEKYKNKVRKEMLDSMISLGYSGITLDVLMLRAEKDHISKLTRIQASDCIMPNEKRGDK
jgi:poly(3-hydroxyalkanoate) synthetase